MSPRSALRRALALMLLTVSAVAAGGAVHAAFADPSPAVETSTVSPATNLIQSQFVNVSWSGFAGDSVFLYQCAPHPASTADCFHVTKSSPTRSDGTGADVFSITTGLITSTVSCDSDHPCALFVVPGASATDLSTGVSTALSFAEDKGACPEASDQPAGVGSHSADRAFVAWLPVVCQQPYSTPIDWSTKNDVEGKQSFTSAQVDYAVTERSLSASQVSRLPQPTTVGYAPLTLSALSFAYNIRDTSSGQRITSLRLTPELLALIFTGQLQTWQDPRIQSLNPGTSFPSNIKAVVRADQCWQSFAVTSWFTTVANDTYLAGGPGYAGGPSEIYPNARNSPLYPATEEPAVVRAVTNPENIPNNDGYQPDSQGVIGFMDSTAAAVAALPVVTLVDSAGHDLNPTTESVLAAYDAMTVNADGTRTPDYTGLDKGAWPLPDLTNFLVTTSGERVKSADIPLIRSFLSYATGDGQGAVLPAGYVPLPASARQQAAAVAGSIQPYAVAPAARSTPVSAAATGTAAATPAPRRKSTPGTTATKPRPSAAAAAAVAGPPVSLPAPAVPAPVVPVGQGPELAPSAGPLVAAAEPVAFRRQSSGGGALGLPGLVLCAAGGLVAGARLIRRSA